jgi:putative ABC transport system permease protein
MGVAAASLAIGAIEGVLERRRTLAHMSATGVSATTLRSATVLEIAAPMVAALILGVAIGIGTGATFIHFYFASNPTAIVIPWGSIGWLVLAAAAATGFVVLATLPMVGRSIGAEGLRTE